MRERKAPGYFTEDLQPRVTGGVPRYTSRTEKPVDYVEIGVEGGAVIGYLYANDEDEAAGWCPRREASPSEQNAVAVWIQRLHEGKAQGWAPTAALDALIGREGAEGAGIWTRVVSSARQSAVSIEELKNR